MDHKFLHELSTPLAALQLQLDLLIEEARQIPGGHGRVQKCVNLAARLAAMVAEKRKEAAGREEP